jgi:hypothetical protein
MEVQMDVGSLAPWVAVLVVLVLKAALIVVPVGATFWVLTRTAAGRRILDRNEPEVASGMTLEIADQLRGLQAQLDDAHSRLDFAERVMLEQREQLRALGAPEPRAELREPTPV